MYKIKSAFQKFANTAITLTGVVTASCITLSAQSAQALVFSFAPTDFSISPGTGNTNAAPTILINTQTAPNGFTIGSTTPFTTTFLLLGASAGLNGDGVGGDSNIPNDSLRNNNTAATSTTTVNLDSTQVAQPIALNFNWAFNGDSLGGFNDKDNFNIALVKIDNLDGAQLFERTVDPADSIPGYGLGINEISNIPANSLSAGAYRLVISLNENGSSNSSAAGFNNISLTVSDPEPVPFGFSTNASLLVFGGVFYGFNKLKKNMAVKKSQA
ncbi:hypothetical protein [Trichormus sp. NMC-1]|uniref:hypothetical protein n=1 Tax=Trichormus sp. NMC-1 TaxID=1853259 RepID=UPI0008DBEFF0|nr:hypothetical protein [Trichormus sp. NMC-1]